MFRRYDVMFGKEVNRSLRWLSLVLVAPFLTGCASPYHPLREGVGYTDMPVGQDTV